MNKQLMESLQVAAGNRNNVKYINNLTGDGSDYQIKPYENLVIVSNSSNYSQNLFLPHVGESVGCMITIMVPDFGGGGTIADRDDSQSDWADLTNDADNEYAVLYNDGRGWKQLLTDM